jgi:uncharacterized protein (TIGR03083 family)
MRTLIDVRHLFPVLDQELLALLKELAPEQWQKQSIARQWTVKDIAAHLLDGNVRGLAMSRDGYFGVQPENVHNYQDLVKYLNSLNADWVTAMKRMSPQVLISMLETTGQAYSEHLASLDLSEKALFAVAWAGEEASLNWFHVAREYTEKWIHQQQIRDAVGQSGLMTKELFHPFLDTVMRGMPHAFRKVIVPEGTTVQLNVTTEAGGTWFVERNTVKWQLKEQTDHTPAAVVTLDPDTAWKLFSKGMEVEEGAKAAVIQGDEELGMVALEMVAVMA